jgi:hypothetical protein
MDNQSRIDPSRKTVGSIYRDAQINGERGMLIGDVNHEIKKGLVEDINIAIITGTKELGGKPFYLAIYEKADLMMKKGTVRIPKITPYRPYPEQDSMVFHVYPTSNEVYCCWALPHRTEMVNMLNTPELRPQQWEQEELQLFRHWENLRLEYFGFKKDDEGNWVENPLFRGDKLMSGPNEATKIISLHQSTDTKERHLEVS